MLARYLTSLPPGRGACPAAARRRGAGPGLPGPTAGRGDRRGPAPSGRGPRPARAAAPGVRSPARSAGTAGRSPSPGPEHRRRPVGRPRQCHAPWPRSSGRPIPPCSCSWRVIGARTGRPARSCGPSTGRRVGPTTSVERRELLVEALTQAESRELALTLIGHAGPAALAPRRGSRTRVGRQPVLRG